PSPALMLRSRAHARGDSKHAGKGIARLILRDGASRLLRIRLPKAAPQAPRSLDRSLYFPVFCRFETAPVRDDPGSALHRSTSSRAASRPGQVSDAFANLIHFSNSPPRSRARFLRRGFLRIFYYTFKS